MCSANDLMDENSIPSRSMSTSVSCLTVTKIASTRIPSLAHALTSVGTGLFIQVGGGWCVGAKAHAFLQQCVSAGLLSILTSDEERGARMAAKADTTLVPEVSQSKEQKVQHSFTKEVALQHVKMVAKIVWGMDSLSSSDCL